MYQLDLSCATGVSSHLCAPGRDTLSLYRLAQTELPLGKGARTNMRTVLWLTLAACLESASVAAASLDMSAITWERFLQTPDLLTQPIVVEFLIGRHPASNVNAAIDFDK